MFKTKRKGSISKLFAKADKMIASILTLTIMISCFSGFPVKAEIVQTNLVANIYSSAVSTGGVTPTTNSYQKYTYTFTATQTQTPISILFRKDPGFFSFDDISVKPSSGGSELLTNGGFESVNSSGKLLSWSLIGTQGLGAAGVVQSSGANSGSRCWYDGAVGGFDGLQQTITTTVGSRYTISFYLKADSWSNKQASTTDPYSDRITQVLVYAGPLPGGFVITPSSNDAGLSSVAAQVCSSPTGGNGSTSGTPINWSVSVADSKSTLGRTDIAAVTGATFKLYSDASFSSEVTGTNTISLTSGGTTTAYVKVTAQDATTVKYYAVTINRAAPSDTVAPTFSVSGNPTTWTNSNVTLTVNASDAGSGLNTSGAYSYDNGSTWTTSNTQSFSANGTVNIKVRDNAGNISSQSVVIDKIDKTAPVAPTLVADKTSLTNTNVTVTITYPNDANIKQYKIGNGDWTSYTAPVVLSANDTISAQCQDLAGNNSAIGSLVVSNIDKTAPTMPTLVADKTAPTNTNVTVTITYPNDANIKQYKIGNGDWTNYTAPVVLSDNDTISAQCQDSAGNTSEVGNITITNIDKVNPTINITGNPEAWTSNNVGLNISTTAGISGVQSVTVQKDNGAVVNITGQSSYIVSTNGAYKFIVTNGAGVTDTKTINVTYIDKVTPTLSIDSIKTGGNNYVYSGTVPTEKDVVFTLSDTNSVISGVTFYWSTDGTSWNSISGNTFTVSNTNDTTVNYKFKAISGSGLETSMSSPYAVYIVKPSFTNDITVDTKTSDNNAYTGNWTNKDITYTLSKGINDSAFLKYQYSTNPTDSASWTDMGGAKYNTLTVSNDINTTYYFRAVAKGLSSGSQTYGAALKLDKTAPTDLTISFKGNSFKKILNKITFGIFSKDNVDVNISAESNISGLDYIEYQLVDTSKGEKYDAVNGKWVKYTSLSISPQFKGVIYARAKDKAGNLTAVVSSDGLVVDNVEPTAPVITATVDGNPYTGEWTSKDVVISASGASALAGVDHYEYKLGTNGTWKTMPNQTGAVDTTSEKTINDKLTITEPVGGTYYFRAVSNSGVIGAEITKVIKHENTVPTTKVTSSGKVDVWTKDAVKFNVSNTNEDILCPVTSWIKIGNGDWTKLNDGSYTFDAEINQPVKFKTVTAAGLENIDPKTYNVMIDKTAPVISGAEEGKTYYIGRVITTDDNSKAAYNSVYKLNNGSNTNFTSGDLISGVGAYDITVTDQAGNVSKLGFTVKALPTVSEVLYTSEWDNLIKDIRSEFDTHKDLPEPYKTNTDNAIKALENRFKSLDTEVKTIKQEVVVIKSDVSKLPAVNDGLIAMLDTIQNEYDKIAGNSSTLTTEEKAVLISEKNDLKQLLDTIKALKDKNADIITRASAIPTAEDGLIAQRDAIKAILDEIAGLTNEQKTILKPTIDALNALLEKAKALQDKVDEEKKKADAIPTADDGLIAQKGNIEKVLDEISKLTPEQKGLLKEKTDALNALLEKAKALQTQVDAVKAKTEVALKGDGGLVLQREKIKALLDEISKLTPEQKNLLKQQIDSLTATLQSDMEKLKGLDEAVEKLQIVYAAGDNADSVTKAMFLTKVGINGTSVTWNSSDTNIITDTGRVTRPEPEEQNKTITLIASIKDSKTNEVIKKQFKLTVKKLTYLEAACKQLTPERAFTFDSTGDTWESVTNKFLLLGKGAYDSTIAWTSNKPSIINISSSGNGVVGTVTRPENQDEDVILTATITRDGATATKTFLMTVKQKNVTKQSTSVRVDTNTAATLESGSSAAPVSVKIKRTTLDNNEGIIDTLIVTENAITALTDNINPLAQAAERIVTINMPQPTDGTATADEQAVEIPASAVQAMAERNAILEVKIGDARIELNTDELKELNNKGTDLYFKVVPIKDTSERSKLGDNTKANGAVIEIAKSLGNGVAVPQGVPYTVETNYSGLNTKLVVPFTGMTIPTENRAAFLASLRVYIEHTDGTKEAKGGTIVYKDGIPVGIEITIDRFSSFQVFSVEQPKANTTLPKTGSVVDFTTILILGALIMLTGFGLLRYRRKKTNTN